MSRNSFVTMEAPIPQIQGFDDLEENAEENFPEAIGKHSGKSLSAVDSVKTGFFYGDILKPGFEGIESFNKALKTYSGVLAMGLGSKTKILKRQKLVLQRWNKILLVLCVIALSLDPLFCYLLFVNDEKKCLVLDTTLGIIAIVLRFVIDFFYVFHIIFHFRASIAILSSQESGQDESVAETRAIAWKYLLFYFIVDILVLLPLPQVVVFAVISKLKISRVLKAIQSLNFIVIFQYVLRVLRICSLLKKATRTSGVLAETAWGKAVFNLFLYMLASHVFGALWYLFSIERKAACWLEACKNHAGAHSSLNCDDTFGDRTFLTDSCSAKTPKSTLYKFGIYLEALESGVIESAALVPKISYCFWWGLKNLSSLGQSLKTSTYVWEIYFSVTISISGLVLFAFLIGNMQTYLQSKTARLEEMRLKEKEIELWMAFQHSLPRKLKRRIWKYQKYKWKQTQGVDVEKFLHNLPRDLRRDTKKHLCSGPLSKVPMLQNMDERLLDAICDHLKPVLYIEHSFIFQEGDPLDEMLLITRGIVMTYTNNGSAEGAEPADSLTNGDFYGEELLDWVLKTSPSPSLSNLPFSTKTVKAVTKVEVFALKANALKNVVIKFWWLFTKDLSHSNSFALEKWKPRAACVLQAAWRRYKREKLRKSARLGEEGIDSPSVSATNNAVSEA